MADVGPLGGPSGNEGGAGGLGRGYSRRVRSINRRYRGEKVQGYLTPEDLANAERQRGRAGKAFGAYSSAGRAGAIGRARARGISSSPALERTLGRFAQDEGKYLENINTGVEGQLYNTQQGREGFERERLMYGWGSELGASLRDWQSEQAKTAQFWNSFVPLATDALSSIFGGGGLPAAPKMGESGFTYPLG